MKRFRIWLANLISGGEIARLNEARNKTRNLWFERWDKAMARLGESIDREYHMRKALQSIADSTCCEGCQEAARVAREALE